MSIDFSPHADRDGIWSVWACDLAGYPISNLTPFASDKKYVEILDRPASFSFTLDPAHPRIYGLHVDGHPFLTNYRRLIKAYRWSRQADGSWGYTLRFAGHAWVVQDDGDDAGQATSVTALDPLNVMMYRFAADAAGGWKKVRYSTDTNVGSILIDLVNRTNTQSGVTGLTTSGGANTATQVTKVEWGPYKLISECFSESTAGTGGVDVWVEPIDELVTGYIGRLHIYETRGTDRPDAVFGWKTPPHTAENFSRMPEQSPATLIVGMGSTKNGVNLTSVPVDPTQPLTLHAVESFSDVRDQTHLDQLATAKLVKRLPGNEAVNLKPMGKLEPWQDFNTGDTVRTAAGIDLRGGVPSRVDRLYGFSVTIDDDDNEDIEVVTQEEES